MLKLSPEIRLLDFDGSVTTQKSLMARLGERARVANLQDLGPSLRYLCSRKAVRRLEALLRPEDRSQLTFIGSGDFHHVTASLLRQSPERLTLVIFDTHSDWDRRAPFPCCGSWVAEALRMPQVQRIVSIGLADADIGGWRINLGHPDALRTGHAAFFPFDCGMSRTPKGPIHFPILRGAGWDEMTQTIIEAIPTGNVYLSIDKDCLVAEDAFTNWETGGMRLAQVASFIAALGEAREVIGADVVGEWSPLEIANPFVRAIARADHPRKKAPLGADMAANERTNLVLLDAFGLGSPRPSV